MEPLLNIAICAARAAGDIIVRNMDIIDRLTISTKKPNDFFSEVDLKAEQAIIKTIHKAHPQHGILAEEGGSFQADAETVWIIDPLDGTNNYLHGFPFFAVSIAVRIKQRIEHAVVFDPVRHECFTASRGRGARLNDRRIRVSKQSQLSAALIGCGFSLHNMEQSQIYLNAFQALAGKCSGVRRTGSAALDLAYVASGRLDGYWEQGLKPWDIAAGSLLIEEAGGLISDFNGNNHFLTSGEVICGTPKVFKGLLKTLTPVWPSSPA